MTAKFDIFNPTLNRQTVRMATDVFDAASKDGRPAGVSVAGNIYDSPSVDRGAAATTFVYVFDPARIDRRRFRPTTVVDIDDSAIIDRCIERLTTFVDIKNIASIQNETMLIRWRGERRTARWITNGCTFLLNPEHLPVDGTAR